MSNHTTQRKERNLKRKGNLLQYKAGFYNSAHDVETLNFSKQYVYMPFDLNSLFEIRKSAFEWKRDRQTEKSETGENKLDLKYFEKWGETFWN